MDRCFGRRIRRLRVALHVLFSQQENEFKEEVAQPSEALLPFAYLSTGLTPDGSRLPISRWIGDPIWCFLVPTISFYFGEIRMRNFPVRSERVVHGIHSLVEVFVCLPAWTFIWLFVQMKIGWISV